MTDDSQDAQIYCVVVNHEEQDSIWAQGRALPSGWKEAGKSGTKRDCLDYIDKVWTDMRPLSLREKMAAQAERNFAEHPQTPAYREDDVRRGSDGPTVDPLVRKLSEQNHPVTVGGPEGSLEEVRRGIQCGYVHVTFTDTRGGTRLGVRLDREAGDLTAVDLDQGTGSLRIIGHLNLNDTEVRCIADIDLATLAGTGRLEQTTTRGKDHRAAKGE
jgi:uncharacterized protein YbdZ (MbtH family)